MERILWKDIKPLITDMRCTVDKDSLICSMQFTFNGVRMGCQFDSDMGGLYGFTIEDPKALFMPEEQQP